MALCFLTLLLGVAYPLLMWGIGELFFHKSANGSLLYRKDGSVLGSEWIAQRFTEDKYFQPRPSSAGYDAAHSSASNLGPTSQSLISAVEQRTRAYRIQNSWSGAIPVDAVTGSGSGLDPHISVENARIQSTRVAKARGLSPDQIDKLIQKHTEGPSLGLFGEKRINVLRINLALDNDGRREKT